MNHHHLRRVLARIDWVCVAPAAVTAAVLAPLALYHGVPVWILPLGAVPALPFPLASWLAERHARVYARTQRTTDMVAFRAAEHAAQHHHNRGGGLR